MKPFVVSASECKAKCLAYLCQIEQSGEPITITKRGRPIASLGPVKHSGLSSPRDSWARKGRIVGEIVQTDLPWDVSAPGLE